MSIFYVFQGETYNQERTGGYVWSPQFNKAGYRNAGYEKMKEIKVGDFILHNANGEIKAISVAKTNCYKSDQPKELLIAEKQFEWGMEGYRIDVEYYDFEVPLITSNYREWLIENYKIDSAFTVKGRGKQQYMCNIHKEHALHFIEEAIRLQKNEKVIECLKKALNIYK